MLGQVVERTRRSLQVDQVVVAASNLPADQPIWQWCQQNEVPFIRGNADDVLSRYDQAARTFDAHQLVRITSDCPLIEPRVIDATLDVLARQQDLDYACNFHPVRTFPRGLDTEVFTRECLDRLVREADKPEYREHVTLMVHRQKGQFKIGSHLAGTPHGHLRWTVDTEKDLALARSIYDFFSNNQFHWQDVIRAYPENPHWRTLNHDVYQKVA